MVSDTRSAVGAAQIGQRVARRWRAFPQPRGEVRTSPDRPRPPARPARGNRVRVVWLGRTTAAVTVGMTLSGHELAALGALVITVGFALCGRRSVLATFPTAFLGVLFTTVVMWSTTAWAGSRLFA